MITGDRRATGRARIVWPYLTLRDIPRIVAVILIIVVALIASVMTPIIGSRMNYGFGPEWNCAWPGKGGPICVKHPAPTNNP
jgi:hypothetical protein